MSCERYETLLALRAGGDLRSRQERELDRHLAVCAACRELAEGLAASQAAIHGLREEEAAPEVLARMRRNVMAKVESQRPPWVYGLRWWHATPVVMVAAVLAVMLFPRAAEVPLPVVAFQPPAAVVIPPAPTKAVRVRPRPNPQISKPAAAAEPLLVKLFTDDPDIVIYWLIDQNGGKS